MKIVCSGCGARHWLSDMQLSSGGCNVVCPHCSTANYVDASMLDPQTLEPRWYYAVNDESVGPLSTQDLEFSYQNGQITQDSYVWCEGLSDWMALSAVSELDYLQSPVSGTPCGDAEATRMAAGGISGFGAFGGGNEETAAIDLNELQKNNGGFSPFDNVGGGIVGMDGQAATDDEPVFDMNPAPAQNPANEMVGARSENSVLFSLSSLQAMSTPVSADAPATAPGSAGLIDVKALAASPAPRKRNQEVVNSFGGGVPMTAVLPLGTKKNNTPIIIGGAVLGVIILGLVIALVVMNLSKEEKAPQAATLNAAAVLQQAQHDDLGVAPPAAPKAAEAQGNGLGAAKRTGEVKPAEEAKPAEETKPAEEAKPAKETIPAADEKPKTAAKTETKTASAKPAAKPAADAGGNKLTKDEVQSVIRASFAQVRTCSRTSDKKGKMNVAFTIKADGRVGGARCTSPEFANTPVATCVIKVVNGMKFRASGSETPITYPFQIQ